MKLLSVSAKNLVGLDRQLSVVMIHPGRCGSTVLANMLSVHKNIFWAAEVYEVIFAKLKKDGNTGDTFRTLITEPLQTVIQSRSRLAARIERVYGFEFKPFHTELIDVPLDTFIDDLEREGFTHFIVLDRKNRLRKICSALIAAKTGQYSYSLEENVKKTSVRIEVGAVQLEYTCKPLIDFLKGYDQHFSKLEVSLENRKTLKLFYEDDIEHDPIRAYKKICEFVGLEPLRNVNVRNKRINPHPLSTMIENYEEVQEYLRGSAFEWMLET